MHYYIDGYNLMFRRSYADDDLQKQRERIIQELSTKIAFLQLNVTLVFDSHLQAGREARIHSKNVEILFTAQGETADDLILAALKTAEKPSQEIVVTSDKRLAWRARRRLAKTETVEEFIAWLDKRYQNKLKKREIPPLQKKRPPPSKNPTKISKTSTTEECFSHYLEIFEAKFKEEPVSDKPAKKQKKKVEQEKPVVESDLDRWLRLFESN